MPTSIYVHTPFCLARCSYCNFYSGEPHEGMEGFPRLVEIEARLRRPAFPDREAETLYIGGGTPSLLGADRLARLIMGVTTAFPLKTGAEVTVEVNPAASLDFSALRAGGVNRVSIGVQALSDDHLKILGRPHTAAVALLTVRSALAAGLGVSADLMYGYASLTVETLLASASALAETGVQHLSAYSLETGGTCGVSPSTPEEEEAQGDELTGFLEKAGYERYEVSNFALPGFESRHNTGYWEGWGYMGLGPGAHGHLPEAAPCGLRYGNVADLKAWAAALEADRLPPGEAETPDAGEALLERLFLALRRTSPFEPARLSPDQRLLAGLTGLVGSGDLEALPGGRLRTTRQGLKRADGLALHLHGLVFPD